MENARSHVLTVAAAIGAVTAGDDHVTQASSYQAKRFGVFREA